MTAPRHRGSTKRGITVKIAGKHEPGLNLRLLCSEAHLEAERRSRE